MDGRRKETEGVRELGMEAEKQRREQRWEIKRKRRKERRSADIFHVKYSILYILSVVQTQLHPFTYLLFHVTIINFINFIHNSQHLLYFYVLSRLIATNIKIDKVCLFNLRKLNTKGVLCNTQGTKRVHSQ